MAKSHGNTMKSLSERSRSIETPEQPVKPLSSLGIGKKQIGPDASDITPTCVVSESSYSTLGLVSTDGEPGRSFDASNVTKSSLLESEFAAKRPPDNSDKTDLPPTHQRLLDDFGENSTLRSKSSMSELVLLGEIHGEDDFCVTEHVSPPVRRLADHFSLRSNARDTRWTEGGEDGVVSLNMEMLRAKSASAHTAEERMMVSAQELGLSSLDQAVDLAQLEKTLEQLRKEGKGPESDPNRTRWKKTSDPPKPPSKSISGVLPIAAMAEATPIAPKPILISELMSPTQRASMNEYLGRPPHSSIPAVYSHVGDKDDVPQADLEKKKCETNRRGRSPGKRERSSVTPRRRRNDKKNESSISSINDRSTAAPSSKDSHSRSTRNRGRSSRPREQSKKQRQRETRGTETKRVHSDDHERSRRKKSSGSSSKKRDETTLNMRDRSRSTSTSTRTRSTISSRVFSDTRKHDRYYSTNDREPRDRSRSTSTARNSSSHHRRSRGSSKSMAKSGYPLALPNGHRDRSRSTSTRGSSRSKTESKRGSVRDRSHSSVSKRDRSRSSSTRSYRTSPSRDRSQSSSRKKDRSITPRRYQESPLRMGTDRADSFQMRFHSSFESIEPSLSFMFRDRSRSRSRSQSRSKREACLGEQPRAVLLMETARTALVQPPSSGEVTRESRRSPIRSVCRTSSQIEVDKALAAIGVTDEQRLVLEQLGLQIRKAAPG